MKKPKQPSIEASIIIRTLNEQRHLPLCLSQIFMQKTEVSYEVIIVDSGSTDRTLEIARQAPTRIITIPRSAFSYGGALNLGCAAARGRYCVFVSAHAIPATDRWLDELISGFDDNTAATYGSQLPQPEANPLARRMILESWPIRRWKRAYMIWETPFNTTNAAIRKDLWLQTRFDDRVIASEDSLWARQVLSRGHTIAFREHATVFHSHNDTLRQFYRRYSKEYQVAFDNTPRLRTFRNYVLGIGYTLLRDLVYLQRSTLTLRWIPCAFAQAAVRAYLCITCLVRSSVYRPHRRII